MRLKNKVLHITPVKVFSRPRCRVILDEGPTLGLLLRTTAAQIRYEGRVLIRPFKYLLLCFGFPKLEVFERNLRRS